MRYIYYVSHWSTSLSTKLWSWL